MTKGLITEEEQRLLQSFWVYCQPVEVYSQLANRQRCNVSPTTLLVGQRQRIAHAAAATAAADDGS